MESQQPKPSEVREQILAEHAKLRGQLDALESMADRLAPEDAVADDAAAHDTAPHDTAADSARRDVLSAEAKAAAERLERELRARVRHEERVLVPALAEADGFGAARVDELHREQEELDEVMAALMREIAVAPGAVELASRLRELVRRVREDLAHEEKRHLSPNVLKDSVVTGAFGG
ncbi:MAG: hemerythrin domain-containing protein [Myxococcota bacterium]|jgi:hypothetical protein|nr:hemerythrin domain-containing protein [Myxococcota bacterium]